MPREIEAPPVLQKESSFAMNLGSINVVRMSTMNMPAYLKATKSSNLRTSSQKKVQRP